MRIILNELKKIFNIKTIILLILINIVMSFLFIEFDIRFFPNGRPNTDYYNIFVDMKESYGEFMDEDEFEDFKEKYEEAKKEANDYIESREDLKVLGIRNYEEFKGANTSEYKNYKEFEKIHSDIIFEKEIDVFWELPVRGDLIDSYLEKERYMTYRISSDDGSEPDEKHKARLREIVDKDIETSVFTDVVFSNYNDLIKNVVMTILVSVIFIITPIYIRDNREKINYLQYGSKIGRKIFKKKILAGFLASFILVTVQLICFFSAYSLNNTSMFFSSNVNSVFNTIISWYDITFIQYIILTVIGTYILSFVFTFIAMLVSSISQNYIAVIAIQLPIALFTFKTLLNYLINFMTDIGYPKGFLGLFYMVLIITSSLLMIFRWRKEKKTDILY